MDRRLPAIFLVIAATCFVVIAVTAWSSVEARAALAVYGVAGTVAYLALIALLWTSPGPVDASKAVASVGFGAALLAYVVLLFSVGLYSALSGNWLTSLGPAVAAGTLALVSAGAKRWAWIAGAAAMAASMVVVLMLELRSSPDLGLLDVLRAMDVLWAAAVVALAALTLRTRSAGTAR